MYESPLGNPARISLEEIATGRQPPSDATWQELSDRVRRAVDELRALGWPIERIVARMKELAREVGRPSYAPQPQTDRLAIIQRIVRLCIEHDYRA